MVALNASGVREVVRHEKNGFLLPARTPAKVFANHLLRLHDRKDEREAFAQAAKETAEEFSQENCTEKALVFYEDIRRLTRRERLLAERSPWGTLLERVGVEWDLLAQKAQSIVQAVVT